MDILAYIQANWLTWFFAVLSAVLGIAWRTSLAKLKKWKAEQDALKAGVMAMLYDRLYQGCKYHIRNKEIADDELKNMETLYLAYHALGGNGTGTELYERVKKLRLKEDD